MKFKIPPQWYIIKEFEYESNKVYKQVDNCVFSDIRADILIYLYQWLEHCEQRYQLWCNSNTYNNSLDVRKWFFNYQNDESWQSLPADPNVYIKPKGKTSTVVFYDEYRELDEENERIIKEYLNQK